MERMDKIAVVVLEQNVFGFSGIKVFLSLVQVYLCESSEIQGFRPIGKETGQSLLVEL